MEWGGPRGSLVASLPLPTFSEEEEEASGYGPPQYGGSGHWETTDGDEEMNDGLYEAVVPGGWGASPATGGVWVPHGPSIAAPGTASCTGGITCTIQWVGSFPPPVVIIKETSIALWSGDLGYANNGLGVETEESEGGGIAQSVRWTVKTENTNSILVSVEPEALVESDDIGGGVCSVQYKVEVFIPQLGFSGVLNPLDDASILIGQRLTVSVELPEELESAQNTFTGWTISSGGPFTDYQPTTTSAALTPWVAPTGSQSSIQAYFAKPGAAQGKSTVAVTVAIPEKSLSFQLTRGVLIRPPVAFEFIVDYSGRPYLHSATSVEDAYAPVHLRLKTADSPVLKAGITFAGIAVTPSEFHLSSDKGTFEFVQLITDCNNWHKKVGGVMWSCDKNFDSLGVEQDRALDSEFPVFGGPYIAEGDPETEKKGFSDSPGYGNNSLGTFANQDIIEANLQAGFVTYLIYKPPGSTSKWVPLSAIAWDYHGHAATGSPWTPQPPGSAINPARPVDFPAHPLWSSLIEDCTYIEDTNPMILQSLALLAAVSPGPMPTGEPCPACTAPAVQDARRTPDPKQPQIDALVRQSGALGKEARRLIKEDRLDEAEACLKTALQMVLSSDLLIQWQPYFYARPFRELLARIAIKRNLWHEAVAHLTAATEHQPLELHSALLGWAKLRAGDVEGSRAMWEPWTGAGMLTDAMPNKLDTPEGLEAMWLTKIATIEWTEELHWLTLAHQKEPTNSYVNDRLGSLLNVEARKLQDIPEKLNERIALYKRAYDHHIVAMNNAPSEELRLEFGRNATGPRIRMEALIKQRDGG